MAGEAQAACRVRSFGSLLEAIPSARRVGNGQVPVTGITCDSRAVAPGWLFIGLRGGHVDGHQFIPQALARGAVALVVEAGWPGPLPPGVPVAVVPDAQAAMAPIARAFYDDPSSRLTLAGVTGTNGKTTTALMIDAVFRAAGHTTGVVGTIEYRVADRTLAAPHTTPQAIELQSLLAAMVDAGVTRASMEVSSHALRLHRVDGCHFAAAAFTNLTPEHLDFHADMADYLEAKARLFTDPQYFPETGRRVNAVNVDDEAGREIGRRARGDTLTYALRTAADCRAEDIRPGPEETRFTAVLPSGRLPVRLRLLGLFNVANALAALATCAGLGMPPEVMRAGLEGMPPVRGRLERVPSRQRQVLVDYAHTPDGLKTVLEAARQLTRGRVIVVFGCGGNRDRTKRPAMGGLASRLADRAVVTSDNPREEVPEAIIEEILAGIPADARERCRVEPDRARAIRLAIHEAGAEDLVLIAGKGHENYQILCGGRTLHFDDREVASRVLAELEDADA